MKNVWGWLGKRLDLLGRWVNSLEAVGFLLMIASSGLDGVYMCLWMPERAAWLGLILNLAADIADLKLSRKFAELQRQRNLAKRKLSFLVLGGVLVAVFYSWFFGYRQLLRVLPAVEPTHYKGVAFVAAGFIPCLLFFCGFASALQDTSNKLLEQETGEPQSADLAFPFVCEECGVAYARSVQLQGHMKKHPKAARGNGKGNPEHERVLDAAR